MCLRMVAEARAVAVYIVPANVLQSSGCSAGGEARSRRRLVGRGVNGGVNYNFNFPPLFVIDALLFGGAHVPVHGAWGARGRV